MSSQRGNVNRKRPQKHQNSRVFKNDLHDTNIRTKRMNMIQINNVCDKCKAILEWKIKYKKYKVLKTPKTCNKCFEKCVKQPYHVTCSNCALRNRICPKCSIKMEENAEICSDIVLEDELNSLNINEDDGVSSSDSDSYVSCS